MKMTVILRLEGLDVKAGAEDIRTFFEGLSIPAGGVYILGGSLKEAFIAFTSEKDGQLAMRCSGKFLKGSQVTLHVSSMAELEHKLMHVLKKKGYLKQPQPLSDKKLQQSPDKKPRPASDEEPKPPSDQALQPPLDEKLPPRPAESPPPLNTQALDANSAFLLGICSVLQSLQSCRKENKDPVPHVNHFQAEDSVAVSPPQQPVDPKPGYVRLFGLPASVTKDDISHFFKGLEVQEVIVNVNLGLSHGCLVKFTHSEDEVEALHFNHQPLGSFCVEVRGACEKMWSGALIECENARKPCDPRLKQNPSKKTKKRKQIVTNTMSDDCLSAQSQKKPMSASSATFPEYIVMVSNLPTKLTKTEIKELVGCQNIAHNKVLHLLDKNRQRTDRVFLIFDKIEDYDYAMNLTGCHVGSNTINVSSVTRKNMNAMLAKANLRPQKKINGKVKPHGRRAGIAAHTCLFVRNMPADVRKDQITRIFSRYVVKEDNIFLLQDNCGNGAGEAVIQFKSQKLAALALKLHGQIFMGSKLLLTPITRMQINDILKENV